MSNFVAENRQSLSEFHYIRKASAANYWFDFSSNKLEDYKRNFGRNFCLVIYGSEIENDAYVMPYQAIEDILTTDSLDHRSRWIGTIQNNIINITNGKSKSVSSFFNQFHLLFEIPDPETSTVKEESSIYNTQDQIDKTVLLRKIEEYNRRYSETKPEKKMVVSSQVARPGPITDFLKEYHDFTCQICGEKGFTQMNGVKYIEAHHIIELHRLVAGSYCSDNIVIVCPTCHRKLHYAKVKFHVEKPDEIKVIINGKQYSFVRTILSELRKEAT